MSNRERQDIIVILCIMAVTVAAAILFAAQGFGFEPRRPQTPSDSPLTPRTVALGRELFFDTRLSTTGEVACANCHRPGYAFTEPRSLSIGVRGQLGKRRSPTLLNVAMLPQTKPAFFWDLSATSLEGQSRRPQENPVEHGQQTAEQVAARLAPIYTADFLRAGYRDGCTAANVSKALASFERTIVVADAPIQRFQAGQLHAMNAAQLAGLSVFNGKCASCHTLPDGRDGLAHNVGSPLRDRTGQIDNGAGRGAFKTPTLLAVLQRPPFLHNGVAQTVPEAILLHTALPAPNAGELAQLMDFMTAFTPRHMPEIGQPALP
jgi:cytochrome c peroxidase